MGPPVGDYILYPFSQPSEEGYPLRMNQIPVADVQAISDPRNRAAHKVISNTSLNSLVALLDRVNLTKREFRVQLSCSVIERGE